MKSKDECFITQDFDSATRTCKDKTCTEGEWLCDANNKGSYVVCGKDKKYGNGQFCESGVCDAASKSCLECKDDTDCNSGKKCQANKCVDTGKTKADGDWNADKKVTVDDLTVIKGKIGDFVSYIKSLITGKSDLAQETHKYLKKMEKNWNAGS